MTMETWSCVTSFCAADSAVAGLVAVSARMYLMVKPLRAAYTAPAFTPSVDGLVARRRGPGEVGQHADGDGLVARGCRAAATTRARGRCARRGACATALDEEPHAATASSAAAVTTTAVFLLWLMELPACVMDVPKLFTAGGYDAAAVAVIASPR